MQVTDIIDGFAKNHALVWFVGRVDIAIREKSRKLLNLFINVVASPSLDYWSKVKWRRGGKNCVRGLFDSEGRQCIPLRENRPKSKIAYLRCDSRVCVSSSRSISRHGCDPWKMAKTKVKKRWSESCSKTTASHPLLENALKKVSGFSLPSKKGEEGGCGDRARTCSLLFPLSVR